MSAPKLLGPAELAPLVQAVIDANPEATNPMSGEGACLYTDPADPSHHCIVGQVAASQRWSLPLNNSLNAAHAAVLAGWPLTADARGWLWDVQDAADSATFDGLPWSSITLPEVPA